MRYVIESYKAELSKMTYRFYITDALKSICRSDGERYYNIHQNIMNLENEQKINEKEDGDEIIKNIKDKLSRMR